MAVVIKYARAYPDPATYKARKPLFAQANINAVNSDVAIANGDSSTSKVFIAQLPSNCIILPQSLLTHTAITSLTSLSIGFAGNTGVADAPAALASALDVSSAGTKNLIAAVTTPNLYKQLWELAGFTRDPAKWLDIIATLGANAGAAGTLHATILFALRGP